MLQLQPVIVTNKQNILRGANTKQTLFRVYTRRHGKRSKAYAYAGVHYVSGWNLSDTQCVRAFLAKQENQIES